MVRGVVLMPSCARCCLEPASPWMHSRQFWARCMGGSNDTPQNNVMRVPGPSGLHYGAGGQAREYEELSPIFLQFLDVVHNVVAQFPTAFEFTDELLGFVAEHAFRCGRCTSRAWRWW